APAAAPKPQIAAAPVAATAAPAARPVAPAAPTARPAGAPQQPQISPSFTPRLERPAGMAPRVERPTGTGVTPRVERPAGTYTPRTDRPAPRTDGQRPYPSRDGGRDGQRPSYPPRDGQRPSYPPRDGQRPSYPPRDGQRPSYPPRDGQQRPPYAGRPAGDRPAGGPPRRDGGAPRPAGGPRLDTRRPIELAELPSLKKAGLSRKKVELKTAPSIEVMKLRPTRRLAGGKKVETEEEKTARRAKAAKGNKGAGAVEKRIRPGLFLNLETLEENVVKTDEKGRPRPRTDALKNQGRRGQQQRAPVAPPEPKVVKIQGDLTVAEFAQKTGLGIAEIITKGMVMGEMLTVNKLMSADLCELIATECQIKVEVVPEGDDYDVEEIIEKDAADAPENLKPRPPVVTIM
ncbi:TPA: hypothetical protein DDW35_09915, partial [Candidatus Sumerlaeota bacterium]|nr:hypothetical protein [Candidatus Sumerlaeota bacterium]